MTNEEFTRTYVDSLTEEQAKELLIVILSAFSAISCIADRSATSLFSSFCDKKAELARLNAEHRKGQKC